MRIPRESFLGEYQRCQEVTKGHEARKGGGNKWRFSITIWKILIQVLKISRLVEGMIGKSRKFQ